ncbi:Putative Argonaute 3 [Halyomorpha halys]|nr:Putative Argonaute 3 [Halyomorpha halys]
MGRSALLLGGEMRKSEELKEEIPKPSGRGRALLASLVAREGSPSVEKITRHLSRTSLAGSTVEEKEPVVMKGSFGREISVGVNYVKLKVEKGKGLFQYDVQYDPPVESRSLKFGILNSVKDVIGDTKLFDGMVLYLPFKLNQKVTILKTTVAHDNSVVTVKITFTKERKLGDPEAIHLYNVLFRRIMVILEGNISFSYYLLIVTFFRLEVWPGYITAIDEYEGGIMLCCDASHRVLRNQTVLQLMDDLQNSNQKHWRDEFVQLILGQSVLTKYNNKVYRIDDVSFEECPNDCFEKSNGEKVRYVDYYRLQYNLRLTDSNQPLLKSRVKMRVRGKEEKQLVSLVPELCFLTGITDTMRADARVMKDITQCISISPNQRHYAINQFTNNIRASPEATKVLSDWGISLDDAYMVLPGRNIPPIDVMFGGGVTIPGSREANWSGASNKNKAISVVNFVTWSVICTRRDMDMVTSFIEQMIKIGPQMGIKINKPDIVSIPDDRTDNYIRSLRSSIKNNIQIVVVIFPLARTDKYSAVKKLCCVEEPIPSQVILARTVRRAGTSKAITLKIALQMNCKLGGTLWAVNVPLKYTMVCGLDTYHDPKRRADSVGALVSSLNQPLTRWYSKIYSQSTGLEFVAGLQVSMIASLQKYREVNGSYPEQITIFRDGVSDGQLRLCEDYELPQIMNACQRISPEYMPKILFVVVQKRINTRLFGVERDKSFSNPMPGTVMDHTITRRYLHDFFLVSQHVSQGTVSPTHYIVVRNTTSMSPDQIQRFTYMLTHLYYNWPGTIRVPAPCQYAHRLAYLIGENIHKEAAESLSDKLFYL